MTPKLSVDLVCFFVAFEAALIFCTYKWGWHRGAAVAYQDIAHRLRAGKVSSYSISADGKSITCHVCGFTSYNPNDVREKYCGKCHVFHESK